jgi:hypothetical protein
MKEIYKGHAHVKVFEISLGERNALLQQVYNFTGAKYTVEN